MAPAPPYRTAQLRNPFEDPIHDDRRYEAPASAEYSSLSMSSAINSSQPLHGNHIRTPSPTPSETRELQTGAIDWKAMMNWKFWLRKEWFWYYVALVIIIVITALITVYHTQIVHGLTPVTVWVHKLRFGWLIPIAVLFVISFPPLFGHEIVAILCGVVWGLGIGFAIVAAGTFIGEVGNFYAFKACCRSRGEKLERTKISYACLAKVVRDGGFKIALVARLSAIPGHFTTAVFSACGMGIIVFSIAAILSLPKQFITVYIGVVLEGSATGTRTRKSKIIGDVVLAISILVTVLAMWYILHQMNKVKPEIIYKRRRARIGKMAKDGMPLTSTTSIDSDSIPLTSPHTPYQQWDRRGAVQNNSEVELFAPAPERAVDYSQGYQMIHGLRQPRDEEEVEWDMSNPYAGIEEPAESERTLHNLPSAMESTSTVYAPVPSALIRPVETLSRLEARHASPVSSDVAETPTQEAYTSSHSHSQNDGHAAGSASQDLDSTDVPYQSIVASPHGAPSPPPSYYSHHP
ncbi:hypothetical protein AX15_001497 [Amanita polypyramis BW_CC]|nr:hypothetical protein AX15_001497 [Amanita polypyramis BW_CC]